MNIFSVCAGYVRTDDTSYKFVEILVWTSTLSITPPLPSPPSTLDRPLPPLPCGRHKWMTPWSFEVNGVRDRGSKTYDECVKKDLVELGSHQKWALD